jgi:Fur family ferric uptake transcriptional regulator
MERSTRQRTSIRDAIRDAGRPLGPAEILEAARSTVPELSLATVYRTVRRLAESGEIQAVTLPGESVRYEIAGGAHHPHFQCTACSRVFDVHACPGNLARLAPEGFTVEDHELTLYGRCRECQPSRRGAKRAGSGRGAG